MPHTLHFDHTNSFFVFFKFQHYLFSLS
jgi:hypothetical protein